jgi:hypothetical protein
VSVTGLMLTVSHQFLDGQFYSFINVLHALTVMIGLAYIPFGKLFHIFQRPANLGVNFYRRAASEGEPQTCRSAAGRSRASCRSATSRTSCPDLGFDYDLAEGGNWQDVCPVPAAPARPDPVAARRRVRLMARPRSPRPS